MPRRLEPEVKEFMDKIGASQFDLPGYRGMVAGLSGCALVIKISRTEKSFWGLDGKLIDGLVELYKSEALRFYCIFLVNASEGWAYQDQNVIQLINSEKWKKDKKNQYKVNPPLLDRFAFSSVERFKNIVKL